MQTIVLGVEGMSCGHCVKNIEGAVAKLAGIDSVKVSLADKNVTVTFDEGKTTVEDIKNSIDDQGYDVV